MNQNININVKMRLISYYMGDNQFMRTEEIYPEKAEELASLLEKTFQTILENRFVSDDMRTVFNGVARTTKVRYVKPDVVPFPDIINAGSILASVSTSIGPRKKKKYRNLSQTAVIKYSNYE